MFKRFFAALIFLSSLSVSAHEGHDIAPGALKSNHGGVVKAGKDINLEYVITGTEIKLYPVTHEGMDLATSEVKLTATLKSPKGKVETAKLETKEGVVTAKIDFKGAYRMEMKVNADVKGKKSSFSFQVEK